jgi:hypothetical protein
MNLVFQVAYATVVGESLWLEMAAGGRSEGGAEILPMRWLDAGHWESRMDIEMPEGGSFEYRYVLRREDGLELKEWGGMRSCEAGQSRSLTLLDEWKSAGSDDHIYESKVFEVADAGRGEHSGSDASRSGDHEFNLHMTRLPDGMVPCVIGGIDALGDWDYSKALPMVEVSENHWQIGMDLPMDWPVEYKYGLYSS